MAAGLPEEYDDRPVPSLGHILLRARDEANIESLTINGDDHRVIMTGMVLNRYRMQVGLDRLETLADDRAYALEFPNDHEVTYRCIA